MMNPQAIMSNLEHGNMLMGANMRTPAITNGSGGPGASQMH